MSNNLVRSNVLTHAINGMSSINLLMKKLRFSKKQNIQVLPSPFTNLELYPLVSIFHDQNMASLMSIVHFVMYMSPLSKIYANLSSFEIQIKTKNQKTKAFCDKRQREHCL